MFYYLFWFAISLIAAVMAIGCLLYLFVLLRDIKQGLSRIEALLSTQEKPKKKK